ncbi:MULTISPECIES: hypothetical protein [Bacillaceae]|uniref:hypothetical protein n=1 Tax=Bacillaceae TaxID=186817 RepID=UPI0004796CD6|nr:MULTISPECIES: hypothetical protein [Bacillaceae]
MKLIEVLNSLSPINAEKHGLIIDFPDIIQSCKLLGQDSSEMIEVKLHELEKQGLIKVVCMDDPGFENLVIGVKLTKWNDSL